MTLKIIAIGRAVLSVLYSLLLTSNSLRLLFITTLSEDII